MDINEAFRQLNEADEGSNQFIRTIKAFKVGDELFSTEEEAEEYLDDQYVDVSFNGMGDWDVLAEWDRNGLDEEGGGLGSYKISGIDPKETFNLTNIDQVKAFINKLTDKKNESLNEDLNESENKELTDLLNQFKTIYKRIKELLSKLPEEEKKEVSSILANISLSNPTVKDDISKIDDAIKDIESRLSKESNNIKNISNQKWYSMLSANLDTIFNDAADMSSFSTYPGMNYYKEYRTSLANFLYEYVNAYYDCIEGISTEEIFKQYLLDNNLDPENIKDNERDFVTDLDIVMNEIYKKEYARLVNSCSFLDDPKEQEIYKEEIIQGWKDNQLPV